MRSSKKRSRSSQNRPRSLGNIVNRVFDSSGPEGKVRGTPQQIIEKYQGLARDAQLSNDRVAAENFLQHAEHYTRMLAEAQRELAAEQEARQQQYQQNGQQANGQQGGREYRERYDRNDRNGHGDRHGERHGERNGDTRYERGGDRFDRAEPRGQNAVRDTAAELAESTGLIEVIDLGDDGGLVADLPERALAAQPVAAFDHGREAQPDVEAAADPAVSAEAVEAVDGQEPSRSPRPTLRAPRAERGEGRERAPRAPRRNEGDAGEAHAAAPRAPRAPKGEGTAPRRSPRPRKPAAEAGVGPNGDAAE